MRYLLATPEKVHSPTDVTVRLLPDERDGLKVGDVLVLTCGDGDTGTVTSVVDLTSGHARLARIPGPVDAARASVGDTLLRLLVSGPGGQDAAAARAAAVAGATSRLRSRLGAARARRWWVRACPALDGQIPLTVLPPGWLPSHPAARRVLVSAWG